MVVPVSPAPRIPVDLIVQLAEGDSDLTETADRDLLEDGLPFARFVPDLPAGSRVRQSFPSLSRRLRAANVPLARPGGGASLDRFLRVRLPPDVSDVRALIAQLRARPDVEQVVLALPTRPASPAVVAQYEAQQEYLSAAASGVDAPAMWADTDGAGVRVCVCDNAFLPHESLAHVELMTDAEVTGLPSTNDDQLYRHGTAALGVIGARPYGEEGDQGTRGLAYGARLAFSQVTNPLGLGAAIDRALGGTVGAEDRLQRGDVLVIEQEAYLPKRDGWEFEGGEPERVAVPAEVNIDVFRAIQTAVGQGITVVEPAGNGCGSLAHWAEALDPEGELFDPHLLEQDSGAVIVGGGMLGDDGTTRLRWFEFDGLAHHGTNHGSRVDCHASATRAVTACCRSPGDADVLSPEGEPVVERWFDGTSAAAAIVGGVVALLQSACLARTTTFLEPAEVRALLQDDVNGTPQTFRAGPEDPEADPEHRVGPQPDLAKATLAVPTTALVWLKDDLRDLDYRSRRFHKFLCPDILVPRPGPPPPPFEHPEMRSRTIAPADASPGGEVRVRVRNRTPRMQDVEVSLWWSEPAPFLHPRFWHPLGSRSVDGVPPGDAKVSTAWRLPEAIPKGPLSWVAGLVTEGEETALLGIDASTDSFLAFLGRSGHLRMLSRQRAAAGHEGAGFFMRLRGMPEGAARHELRFSSALPGDTRVTFAAERPLAGAPEPALLADLRERPARVTLGADDDLAVRVRVDVPPGPAFGWTALAIDQIVDGRQLGRITFEVARGVAADDVS